MSKTCVSQLFFFFVFSSTKTYGRDRMKEWIMQGAVGRVPREAVVMPQEGLKGVLSGTKPWG